MLSMQVHKLAADGAALHKYRHLNGHMMAPFEINVVQKIICVNLRLSF